MRKISLFIAMSLDGYIADSKGGVDWLVGQGNDDENIDAYSDFVKDIDTVLMCWNTYYQIVTELSPNEWVYDDFTTYVVTHNKHASSDCPLKKLQKKMEFFKSLLDISRRSHG